MKHAILIMAHKHLEHLQRLIEYFSIDCDVFIHIDKKQNTDVEFIQHLKTYKQVKLVSQKYDVFWGGTSVLNCELHLLRMAVEQSEAEYFHLISGQDYPVRPLSQFLEFFEINKGKEFLQYTKIPNPQWEDNTYRRLQYYYPYDYTINKKQPRKWVKEQVRIQKERGIKRPIPDEFDRLYGSSQWFSISLKAAKALLSYTDESPSLYHKMWMTFAPEECYVATVLMNLIGADNIKPWNCRFIRWKYENGNRPANLGIEHFGCLLEREYLFARKIDIPCSTKLIRLIDKYLLKDTNIEYTTTGGWIYDGFKKYQYEEAFFRIVAQLCQELGIKSAIDMGCGAGFYVMLWRRIGLPFAGYDANPFTPALSTLLLPQGDKACGVADLTEELEIVEPFEMVVCKDVLPCIPPPLQFKAIKNLARLSSHFILVSWKININNNYPKNVYDESLLVSILEAEGFIKEKYLTARTQIILKRTDCCLFIKKGMQLIN